MSEKVTSTSLSESSVQAFTEALKGERGSLDAWLECNDEAEVRAHVEAYASRHAAPQPPAEAPPSAPVGVEGHVRALRELRDTGDVSDWRLLDAALDIAIAALAQQPAAVDDAALLDAMAREYWKLDPFDMPTPGGDDADVGWRVIEYHGDEPREREVAVHYADDPRAALRAALAAQQGGSDNDR